MDAGLTRVELALRAGLSLDGDIRLLVGAETVGQVRENCRLVRKGPLEAALLESIAVDVPVPAPELLTPALWPALAAAQ
ncbi:hypothetical protein G7085_12060 [Tessaracoccus sp. HDW20]|uniref:hypothetical protein n=1 Tax=Tessaracoccus coleopterorum TaxID=2714950 RepID=UPI0018D2CF0C|nr:hypothetical protein [Tessaracoccus coleopterorum]NHB85103.1 hypothetical protein [Tessaracoccus coleopterorum]